MNDLEQLEKQIKEKQQKIIEENLKNLESHKRAAKEQQEQAYRELLKEDPPKKENPYGILFPCIIAVGTFLIVMGFVALIHLFFSLF